MFRFSFHFVSLFLKVLCGMSLLSEGINRGMFQPQSLAISSVYTLSITVISLSWIQISISFVPNYLVLVSWIAHFLYSPCPLCSLHWNTSTFRTLHLLFLLPRMSFIQTYLWRLSPSLHINTCSNIISSVKSFLTNLFKLTITFTLALTTHFPWFIFLHGIYPLAYVFYLFIFNFSVHLMEYNIYKTRFF